MSLLSKLLALGLVLAGCGALERPESARSPARADADASLAPSGEVASPSAPPVEAPPVVGEAVAIDTVALAHEGGTVSEHLARAAALEQGGDLAAALTEVRRAGFDGRGPEVLDALESVARLAEDLRRPTLLRAALEALTQLSPADALPALRLARLLLVSGDARGAWPVAAIAVARAPGSPEAFHLRGRAALELGREDEATRDLEAAVILNPRDSHALNDLGVALLASNHPRLALDALLRAAELAPHLACIQRNAALAFERTGSWREAGLARGRALALDPASRPGPVGLAAIEETDLDLFAIDRGDRDWPAILEPDLALLGHHDGDEPSGWDLQ